MTTKQDIEDISPSDFKRMLLESVEPLFTHKKAMDIIKFIKHYQDKNPNKGLTKEEIARYMDNAGILSRPTTLRIINELNNNVILNTPKKPNAKSHIIINPEFDFKTLELNYLALLIIETQEQFEPLKFETRGVNTALIRELLATIGAFGEKQEIYTPKQMEKFESDYQKKTVKQLEKLLVRSREKR